MSRRNTPEASSRRSASFHVPGVGGMDSGKVFASIDGIRIDQERAENVHRLISLVLQDPHATPRPVIEQVHYSGYSPVVFHKVEPPDLKLQIKIHPEGEIPEKSFDVDALQDLLRERFGDKARVILDEAFQFARK